MPNETTPKPFDTLDFDIPPFSPSTSKLIAELDNENVEVATVIQLIECEPKISTKVLEVANSPLYAPTRPITTIGHATVVLGFRAVAQQAIIVASSSLFQANNDNKQIREATHIQSLAVAVTGRALAKKLRVGSPDEAFLCGAIHDVGKLILLDHDGDCYAKLLLDSEHGDTTQTEVQRYGICHAELGQKCGTAWSLPSNFGLAIAGHHTPIGNVVDPLTRNLIISNYMTRKLEMGFSPTAFVELPEINLELDGIDDEFEAQTREQFETLRDICCQ